MISKTSGQSGLGVLIALAILVAMTVVGVSLTSRSTQEAKQSAANVAATAYLRTAHCDARLLKQELADLYALYETSADWAPCRKNVGITGFLANLQDPTNTTYTATPALCAAVPLTLSYFERKTNPAAALTLGDLATTPLVPKEILNGFRGDYRLNQFNLNTERNQVIVDVELVGTTPKDFAKTVRTVIDLKRTLAWLSTDPECHLCRTVPGSVCCGDAVNIAYLDNGSGAIFDVFFEPLAGTVVITRNSAAPNVLASTIRNFPSARTDYGANNFCIPAIQPDPVMYIRDVANTAADTYHLTNAGAILRNGVQVALNPVLKSIAFDNNTNAWYLLRTDGMVLKTTNIEDISTHVPFKNLRLPTAKRLVIGNGPTNLVCP